MAETLSTGAKPLRFESPLRLKTEGAIITYPDPAPGSRGMISTIVGCCDCWEEFCLPVPGHLVYVQPISTTVILDAHRDPDRQTRVLVAGRVVSGTSVGWPQVVSLRCTNPQPGEAITIDASATLRLGHGVYIPRQTTSGWTVQVGLKTGTYLCQLNVYESEALILPAGASEVRAELVILNNQASVLTVHKIGG